MPKDSGEKQSRLGQIKKQSAGIPGPGHYDLAAQDQKRWAKVLLGSFSKMPRDAVNVFQRNKTPPVGYYNADLSSTKPRLKNGKVSQSPRVCAVTDTAERRSRASPTLGFYKPNDPTYRVPTPSFAHGGKGRASSAPPGGKAKSGGPGPGSYEIKYIQVDEEAPWNMGNGPHKETFDKEVKKTFIDRIQKDKAKVPAPGHVGNVDALKYHNKVSPRLHALKLLADRPISAQDFSSF